MLKTICLLHSISIFLMIRVTEENGEADILVSIKTEKICGKLTIHISLTPMFCKPMK